MNAEIDELVSLVLDGPEGKWPKPEDFIDYLREPIGSSTSAYIDNTDFEPSELEGDVSDERFLELENGSIPTKEELQTWRTWKVKSLYECEGPQVFYFKVADSKNREIYFSQDNHDDMGLSHPPGSIDGPFLELPDEGEFLEEGSDYSEMFSFVKF